MYPRNLRGYGASAPHPKWPEDARVAVQFVLNYEEGGENCVLHGDAASEAFLSDIPSTAQWPGQRHWNMESIYEYGARAGFWRVHRMFTEAGIPLTIYGVASALARSPEQVEAMKSAGWEIASHGLKWVEHKDMPEDEERASIAEAVRLHTEVVGERPAGWYTGRCSANTVRLVAEEGGFDYISDAYDDDLPHWMEFGDRDQLIIPYTLEANDMRFATAPGWVTGRDFENYLTDAFDTLYKEGEAGRPAMMTVGLHCRLIGRPGKIAGLQRFIKHIRQHVGVWCPRRIDIARHWANHHPHKRGEKFSQMDVAAFIGRFQAVIPEAPAIIEQAAQMERGPAHDAVKGIHSLLCRAVRRLSEEDLNNLAGSLMSASNLEQGYAKGETGVRDRIELLLLQRVTGVVNGEK
ncbi:allantoinase PuuE [Roseovarius sp. 2305UL8-3]|uniref:allantoinase PuuE n=1 Tax=Roseovarius conchicola TaxID=3121636 RepID=UPI0035270D16